MKKRKNILAILLAVTLMASAAPGSVFTAQASEVKAQTASETKESEKKEKITVTKLTTPELEESKFERGTKKKDMKLPDKLSGKGYKSDGGDKKSEDIKIRDVTWKTDYTEDSEAGKYTFTAQLPKGYELAKDVTLPKLTIEITGGKETEKATEKKETAQSEAAKKETEKNVKETEKSEKETDKKASESGKKAETKATEAKESEKKTETKAAEAKESEKKTETKAAEAKESEKKTETKASEAKESEKKVETKASEVKESEKKTETKVTEAKESEKKTEIKTPETKGAEIEVRTPETKALKESDTPDAKSTEESNAPQTAVPEEKESETASSGDKTSESENAEFKITAFEVKDAKVTIDEEKKTITILMQKADADLKKLAPKVTVPEGVTVEPKSEAEVDFSASAETPVVYKLTKTADGTVAEYKATASICKHDWKDATCTEAAVCKNCGAVGTAALGHDWKDATCTEPAVCKRCGATGAAALGHDWTKATCAVKSTCTRCKITQGELAKHSWSKWKVVTKATHSKKGKQERLCKVCGKEETKTLPKKNWIGEADNNEITGLNGTGSYSTGTNITFKAVGDRMDNKEPIEGDIRYKPVSWTCGTGSGDLNGDNGYSKTIQFTTAGDYTLKVTYERQTYKNGKWVKKGDSDVQSAALKITGKTITNANGTRSNSNVKTAAATGDNSPIVILAVILAVSLVIFIWMAVINRRRRRDRK